MVAWTIFVTVQCLVVGIAIGMELGSRIERRGSEELRQSRDSE